MCAHTPDETLLSKSIKILLTFLTEGRLTSSHQKSTWSDIKVSQALQNPAKQRRARNSSVNAAVGATPLAPLCVFGA